MSKTKKIISLLLVVALVMTMATVAIVSASAASTVYFENSAGWGAINVYYWGGSDTPGWPGVPCTDLGNNIWSASVPDDCTNVIFNDGSNQTSDLTFPGDGFIAKLDGGMGGTEYGEKPSATWEAYNNSDDVITTTAGGNDNTDFVVDGDGATVYFSNGNYWETVYIHYWDADGNGTTWPGVPMNYAFTNEYSQDVYNYTVPAGTAGIIFTAGQNGPQTMDIKEGIVDNAGFYIDMSSTQNDQGHWAYGTWTYIPTGEETTAKPVETTAEETTAEETTAEETTAEATTAEETTAEETTATPVVDNGVSVDGALYDVAVGDTITYTYDLTAERLFENIQATVYYDSAKLELVRHTSDDPDVEDWEVEGPIACPNLDGVIFNAGIDGIVKLNASKVAGYNFKETKTLVTLQFKVKDASYSEIYTVIEEMTIKGGEESYFTGGEQVITEGLSTSEYLDANVITSNTAATTATQATETTAEGTTAEPGNTGIGVNGVVYQAQVGDKVTYVFDLTAARLFENIQATVVYDSTKLELVRHTSDDPDVEDWEVEGPIACPNLDGVIFNAGIDGIVKLNASKVAGYNFKDTKVLVTLEFVVKDTAYSEINTIIEEMTIKGGDESYFENGQQVITEGITLYDYLGVPQHPTTAESTTVEPTETTAQPTTAEPTTAEPTTAEPTTAEPTTAEPTTAEPTTAEPTTAEPTTAEPTTAEPTTAEPTTAEPTTAKPVEPTTAKPVEPTTAKPVEPTTAKPVEPTTAKPVEPTTAKPVEPTTDKGEVTTATGDATTVTASADASASTGTNGNAGGTSNTGAATYIYVAIAVLTMAAFAVVVLRKRAND